MKLPNKEYAYIQASKLTDYLLSETHPVGKLKAKLFRTRGFNKTNIELLMEGLLNIARSEDVTEIASTPHGVKYLVDGYLSTPDKDSIRIRTVWIIDKDQVFPRFVTAYPV